ncbi:MAG: hypothetical protein ABIH65_01650 [Nanoarchaeota archaeon]
MGAFIYTENWSRTKDSDKPVTYYVISITNHSRNPNPPGRGCYEVRILNKKYIKEEIIKIQRRGNISIFGKLPPRMSSIEERVLKGHPEKPIVRIKRKGYDVSFLRRK